MVPSTRIDALLTGKAVPFRGEARSAIVKSPHEGRLAVTTLGLAGDEQADRTVHGGPDKALHHYPHDHYAEWAVKRPSPKLSAPGAFGENISTHGLTEETVCIGDRFQFGSAVIEISQPRQPCWKQAHALDWPTLPKLMVQAAKSGWYYRVIQEGAVSAGDSMTLIARPLPDWSVARVFRCVMHKSPRDSAALHALADMELLERGWRDAAAAQAR